MAAQKRGLGRGLDALFAENSSFEGESASATEIRLSEIFPDRNQPRSEFDEQALEELASSITNHGVLQPIVVRPCEEGYKIVAGERRWRAARLAGLSTIPAIIRDFSDSEAAEIALVENLQRENLNPVEEAEGYRGLMERCGYTQEQAAQRVGKSRSSVTNSLRILTLPEQVLDLLKKGRITAGHAKAILSLPNSQKQVEAANLIARESLSVRDAEKRFSKPPKQETLSLPKAKSTVAQEVELSLKQTLGVEVNVDYNEGRGKLTVSFYSKEQLFEFANKLGADR